MNINLCDNARTETWIIRTLFPFVSTINWVSTNFAISFIFVPIYFDILVGNDGTKKRKLDSEQFSPCSSTVGLQSEKKTELLYLKPAENDVIFFFFFFW